MNEKSYVSHEQRICLVCGNTYDTGALLLDGRLQASMHRHTTVGWGLCAEHQKLYEDGFIALVECDPEKSGKPASGATMRPEEGYRTGTVAHVRRELFGELFNVQVDEKLPAVFVETGVIDMIQARLTGQH